jgi:hypothetical protein
MLDKAGGRRKIQDIIKEDYLLCPECEKGISIVESYTSLRLERFNNLRYFQDYQLFKHGSFEFFECLKLDNKVFNIFIYSIIWRVSISESYSFKSLKLDQEDQEKLRSVLEKYIYSSQEELFSNLKDFNVITGHSHVLIRPRKKLRPPNSMLSCASRDNQVHQFHLVDYLLFYFTKDFKIEDNLLHINNNLNDRLVRVGLSNPNIWGSFNYDMMKTIKNRHMP